MHAEYQEFRGRAFVRLHRRKSYHERETLVRVEEVTNRLMACALSRVCDSRRLAHYTPNEGRISPPAGGPGSSQFVRKLRYNEYEFLETEAAHRCAEDRLHGRTLCSLG